MITPATSRDTDPVTMITSSSKSIEPVDWASAVAGSKNAATPTLRRSMDLIWNIPLNEYWHWTAAPTADPAACAGA